MTFHLPYNAVYLKLGPTWKGDITRNICAKSMITPHFLYVDWSFGN